MSLTEIMSRATVRVSKRSRSVHLNLSLLSGLEIVIPRGFDQRGLRNIIEDKSEWISAVIRKFESQRDLKDPCLRGTPPPQLMLRAVEETWDVTYRDVTGPFMRVFEDKPLELVVCRSPSLHECSQAGLRSWMQKKARRHLVPWLEAVSHETAMPFERVAVRVQKTRWASFSRSGTVSVNSNLLFLPKELVRYVFVHELCHGREMNHSDRFWRAVHGIEPDFASLDERLKGALWRYVPLWTFS